MSTRQRIKRKLSTRNVYDASLSVYRLTEPWSSMMGTPETNGAWLVWGKEKNGKTTFALQLANYLSSPLTKETNTKGVIKLTEIKPKVWYISAEEGLGPNFRSAMQRAGIPHNKTGLVWEDYLPLEEIREGLEKNTYRVVFLDNITIYADELKNGAFRKLLNDFPSVLFVFLAHEERGEPYTATAKLCSRLAKIKVHVEGMAAQISGRCPGGKLMINEEKAILCHGQE